MDEFTHGGTPPMLWANRPEYLYARARRHITHHDDCGCKSEAYEKRLLALAKQIEKLSWMLELMDQEPGINLEEAEEQWQYEHANLS